ncbi:hypothetical protein A6R68_20357, partial [Neotoma lepida]
ICYTCAITPKMLQNFMVAENSLSFERCEMQLFVFATFEINDCYSMAAMTALYICSPSTSPASSITFTLIFSQFSPCLVPMLTLIVFVVFNLLFTDVCYYLLLHHGYHPKDVLYCQEEESFLHLCLLTDSSHYFSWNNCFCVRMASF